MTIFTTLIPWYYDTALYHAQAIRWIEEYGVVAGLGNLHFRFAYNSAFMPLQALFSFRWMGSSLHTVNGFICCFAVVYSLTTSNFFKHENIKLSDLFKAAMLIYIYLCRYCISSPNSDTMAMVLVLYICIKWSEFAENDEKEASPYSYICILCVWAATIKLSVAVCVMLALYPFMLLIKRKQYKEMVINLCAGICVAIPWLIRNVIISGYLLYPYSRLDLFSFDWKMPRSVADYDAKEIMVWGRGLHDVELYDMPFKQWFPLWFQKAPKYMVIMCLIAVAVLIGNILYCTIRKKRTDCRVMLIFIYSIVALAFWMFSAPLIRYGMVYLIIPVCEVIWLLLEWKKTSSTIQKGVKYAAVLHLA